MNLPDDKNIQYESDENEKFDQGSSLIDYNLSLSYEQRLINHQNALETINELIKARKELYGES